MTDREILAELKKSYEYIYDIRENGCEDHCNGQINNKKSIDKLNQILNNIEDVYDDFYEKILKKNKDELFVGKTIFGNRIFIGNSVNCDYSIENYETKEFVDIMTCEDLNYYWYDDKKFLGVI